MHSSTLSPFVLWSGAQGMNTIGDLEEVADNELLEIGFNGEDLERLRANLVGLDNVEGAEWEQVGEVRDPTAHISHAGSLFFVCWLFGVHYSLTFSSSALLMRQEESESEDGSVEGKDMDEYQSDWNL